MKIGKLQDTKANLEAAAYGKFADSRALAAWRWFRISHHPECMTPSAIPLPEDVIQRHQTASRLDALKDHEKAMHEMDASFFRDLADFFDFMRKQVGPHLLAWHAFGRYVLREQRKIEQRKRSALKNPIRYREVKDFLRVSERTFATIYKAWGIPLAKETPGPKPRRKARK